MEFLKKLIEPEESIKYKEFVKENDYSYENHGFRLFNGIKISNEITLSIQASYSHYCNPRKTLTVDSYTSMELAIIYKDEFFTEVEQVISNIELIDKFKEYQDGSVYGYVPVALLEELYQELTKNN